MRLQPAESFALKAIEFAWAGYREPNAHVPPGTVRPFDAFFILEDLPTQLKFNTFATGTDFIPTVAGEGCYDLSYVVACDNFPEAQRHCA